jgi:hypothetical protein
MSLIRRRAAVTALYGGYAVAIAVWLRTAHTGVAWTVLSAAAVVSVAGLAIVWRASAGLVARASRLLDERQRSVRDRAFRISYLIVSATLIATCLLLAGIAIRSAEVGHVDRSLLALTGLSAFLLSLSAPLAVIAWTEPEPPEDSGTFTSRAR